MYRGLKIAPQRGLVPMGRDPDSRLWEFAGIETGPIPRRGADGRLALTPETGVLFVLLPGGTFTLGAERGPQDRPNSDPLARSDESPLREMTLAPFFLAKYEMTSWQWHRVDEGHWGTPMPVTGVSWRECVEMLRRVGFLLPTEAQWEYAARAGTVTPWPVDTLANLRLAANLDYESGERLPACTAVGQRRPNLFGLHDMIGNVWEWCRDHYGPYAYMATETGTGLRSSDQTRRGSRVLRGGSYDVPVSRARSARRHWAEEEARSPDIGVRPSRALIPGE